MLILVAVVGSVTVLGAVLPASIAFSPVQGLVWLGVAGLAVVGACPPEADVPTVQAASPHIATP